MPDAPRDLWPGKPENDRYGRPYPDDAGYTVRWVTIALAMAVVALLFMAVGGVIGYQFGELAGQLHAYRDTQMPAPQLPPNMAPAHVK